MGMRAHIIEWKRANLEGCADFYDLLDRHFDTDEGECYIETQRWEDLMKDQPELAKKWPLETKEVEQDLKENGGAISYAFF